ncbi:efflux RND transporter periplasmic adaptor subunit [uncultured Pseudodesulfovibrio sp.]|uniref:efflux RND transporter periplasmic adaptor subunit n=1 Tax=uncultured Pseudodesulfovibrio sp. TaxID=2035858 RepID=UPI0029C6AE95|nr:efflux RND transporter periplasmic adaptor subunit [uncultured Pseudodesulfovibrio sp.]
MASLKKRIASAVCFTLATVIVVVWFYRLEEQEALARSGATRPAPLRVHARAATTGQISQWVMAEGTAEAVKKSFLQFEEAGKVVFIGNTRDGKPLREGVAVHAGQLLARIDSRDKLSDVSQGEAEYLAAQKEIDMLQATMAQAENDLAEAKRSHERKKKLFDQNFLAQSEYDEAKFRYTKATSALSVARLNIASAKARLNKARAELTKISRSPEKLEIRAPFDGILARMNIKVGDYFDPADVAHANKSELSATTVFTVIAPKALEITLLLPEHDGRQVHTYQQVIVSPGFESWPQGMSMETAPKVNGTVYSVSPQIDGKRRAIRVKVRLTQEDATIMDGMFTSCWIKVASKNNALRIPLSSLLYDGSQPYSFIFENGIAKKRDLEIGLRNTEYVEVTNGLHVEDMVICKGREKLVDGAPIALVKPTGNHVR